MSKSLFIQLNFIEKSIEIFPFLRKRVNWNLLLLVKHLPSRHDVPCMNNINNQLKNLFIFTCLFI
jgi:hypothetical protein